MNGVGDGQLMCLAPQCDRLMGSHASLRHTLSTTGFGQRRLRACIGNVDKPRSVAYTQQHEYEGTVDCIDHYDEE
jgi:hypothetical protein